MIRESFLAMAKLSNATSCGFPAPVTPSRAGSARPGRAQNGPTRLQTGFFYNTPNSPRFAARNGLNAPVCPCPVAAPPHRAAERSADS
jgi:hypothetical protein